MSPNVSVIIVNYNSGKVLQECLPPLLDSQIKPEILIVDNCSTDRSIDDVSSLFVDRATIKIIKNNSNLGFAKACNIGMHESNAPFLMLLNPDCVLAADALEQMYAFMQENNQVGMLGGQLVNPDGTEQVGGRRSIPTPWRSFVSLFKLSGMQRLFPRLFSGYSQHSDELPGKPVDVDAISGACMFVRKKALDEVGLLDEGYFMHVEDLDWCMRFRQKGWRIMFMPQVKAMHYKGICSASKPIFVEWHKHKGMLRFYNKFFLHSYSVLFWPVIWIGIWTHFVIIAFKSLLVRISTGLRPGSCLK